MGDNEIRTDVDTSIKVETSGQSDVQQMTKALDEFSSSLNNIKSQIGVLDTLDTSKATSAVTSLKSSLDSLIDSAFSLNENGIINDDQLESVLGVLQGYINTVNTYSSAVRAASTETERYNKLLSEVEHGGMMKKLQANSYFNDNDKQDNSAVYAKWDQVDKEFQQYASTLEKVDNIQDEVVDGLQEGEQPVQNTSLNLADLEKTLLGMVKSGKLSSASIEGLLTSLGAAAPEIAAVVAAFTVLSKVFSEISKATDEVIDGFKGVGIQTGKFLADITTGSIELFVDGLNNIADAFSNISSFCADCVEQIKEFADIGGEVQDAYFKIYEYLGADAGQNIINYTKNLSELTNTDFKGMLSGMKSVLAVTSQLGLDADGVTKYTKALNNMALDLSVFSGESIENIVSQYENAINLGVLNSRSAIAKAFDLTDSDIKQFKSLNTELERTNFLLQRGESIQGLYNQYLDTAAGKVNQLKNAWSNFTSTVGQLALQLYAIVAPVLTKLVNLATYAVNVLAKLLHLDLSTNNNGLASAFSNNMADNVGKYADNIGKVGDNIEDTGKKAKDASRKVASFDDVIQINEDKSSDSKTAGLTEDLQDLQNYDPSSWLDEFGDAIDDVTDYSLPNLKKMLKDLLDQFKQWEEGLDWQSIREQARGLGKDLASLLNIIIDDKDAWHDFGDLMANSLNTGLEFLNGFGKELHWQTLGTNIAEGWNTFWETLDADLASDTVYTYFKGVLTTAIAFLAEHPFTNASAKISEIFAGIIDNLSTGSSLRNISDFIDLLFADVEGAINTALDTFEEKHTGEEITKIISKVFERLGMNLPSFVETVSRLAVDALDLLGNTVSSSINSFFDGLTSDPAAIDNILNSIINVISAVFANIGKIGDALAQHKDEIISLINGFIQKVFDNSEEWGKQLAPIVDTIVEVLKSLDWTKIRGAINTIIREAHIEELIKEWLNLKFQMFLTDISAKLTAAGGIILKVINTVLKLISGDVLGATVTFFDVDLLGIITDFGQQIGTWWTNWEFRQSMSKWFSEEPGKWKKGFLDAWNGIKTGVLNIVAAIKSAFNGLVSSITNIINNIKSTWNNIIGGKTIHLPAIVGGGTFMVPRLATGAIVSGSTFANIGEDGTEAVLPLEKNTGWMDVLASKLADRINSGDGTNSSPLTIQLSNKNFYTRSEMLDFAEQVVQALRIYGVNVSVAF